MIMIKNERVPEATINFRKIVRKAMMVIKLFKYSTRKRHFPVISNAKA